MKKNIILSNGIVKEMNVEEVLEQFKPLIRKFAYQCSRESRSQDIQDYEQIARITIFECFNDYDEEHAFTTRLIIKLKGERSKIMSYDNTRKLSSTILIDTKNMSEYNKQICDSFNNKYNNNSNNNFDYDVILNDTLEQLTESERDMYYHVILCGMSVSRYGAKIGASRQCQHYRYKKLLNKLKKIYLKLEAC